MTANEMRLIVIDTIYQNRFFSNEVIQLKVVRRLNKLDVKVKNSRWLDDPPPGAARSLQLLIAGEVFTFDIVTEEM